MANLKEVYDQYRLQLDKNKLSAQNELNKATSKSRTYMDNYLKALGLQGSGVGATANAQLGSNYASQMAQINADYNAQKLGLEQDYINQQKTEAQNVLSGLNTNKDINNYLDSIKNTSSYDYAKNIAQGKITANEQASFENEKQKNLSQVYSQMEGLESTSPQYKELQNLATEIEYSQDSNSLKGIYDSYLQAQQEASTSNFNTLVSEYGISSDDKGLDNSTMKSTDFGKFFRGDKPGSNQSKYANAVIKAGKEGKIPNGTTIDMNYGAGNNNAIFMYYDGKWYKTKLNKEAKADYTNNNIDELIGEWK